jgi:hypothetical protein
LVIVSPVLAEALIANLHWIFSASAFGFICGLKKVVQPSEREVAHFAFMLALAALAVGILPPVRIFVTISPVVTERKNAFHTI